MIANDSLASSDGKGSLVPSAVAVHTGVVEELFLHTLQHLMMSIVTVELHIDLADLGPRGTVVRLVAEGRQKLSLRQ